MIGSSKMVLYLIYLLPLCFVGMERVLGLKSEYFYFCTFIQKGQIWVLLKIENMISSSAFSGGHAYHFKGVNTSLEG